MPLLKSKKNSPAPAAREREVVYPDLRINGNVKINPAALRINCATMKEILGWETEAEWSERLKREQNLDPKSKLTF